MKIEIDISDEILRAAITRRVEESLRAQLTQWPTSDYIGEEVKRLFKGRADAVIADVLDDHEAMRTKIVAEVERRLKNQIASAMKAAAL